MAALLEFGPAARTRPRMLPNCYLVGWRLRTLSTGRYLPSLDGTGDCNGHLVPRFTGEGGNVEFAAVGAAYPCNVGCHSDIVSAHHPLDVIAALWTGVITSRTHEFP